MKGDQNQAVPSVLVDRHTLRRHIQLGLDLPRRDTFTNLDVDHVGQLERVENEAIHAQLPQRPDTQRGERSPALSEVNHAQGLGFPDLIVGHDGPVDPIVFELVETDGQFIGTKDFFFTHGISPL